MTVVSLTITPDYASNKIAGANGFLKVDGAVTLYEGAADGCDCYVSVRILVDGVDAGATHYVLLKNDTGAQLGSAAITAVVSVSANSSRTVALQVNEYSGTELLASYASLTALYVPFGSTGTDLLGAASSAGADGTSPGE